MKYFIDGDDRVSCIQSFPQPSFFSSNYIYNLLIIDIDVGTLNSGQVIQSFNSHLKLQLKLYNS